MVDKQLRASGIFLGSVFLAGGLLTLILGLMAGRGLILSFLSLSVIGCLAIAIVFYLSAWFPKFFWIQPVVFLLLTPLPVMQEPESLYGLGFFVFAMAMLFRMGFFETRRILKLILSLSYLMLVEVVATVFFRKSLGEGISVIFFILAFLVFFYLMFQEKLLVFLSAPKQKLSLSDKGLSDSEIDYVFDVISGKSVKETAFDAGVSESTVRNMLVRSYSKLGINTRAELFTLAEKFELTK